jgi:hypothetical protein
MITRPDSSAAVDAPPPASHWYPEELLQRRAPRVMVTRSGSLIQASCMPRIWKSELLEIEMMTELVAESAHERAERCDFFAYCRPHPYADHEAMQQSGDKLYIHVRDSVDWKDTSRKGVRVTVSDNGSGDSPGAPRPPV